MTDQSPLMEMRTMKNESKTFEYAAIGIVILILALTVYSWLIPKLQGSLEKTVKSVDVRQMVVRS